MASTANQGRTRVDSRTPSNKPLGRCSNQELLAELAQRMGDNPTRDLSPVPDAYDPHAPLIARGQGNVEVPVLDRDGNFCDRWTVGKGMQNRDYVPVVNGYQNATVGAFAPRDINAPKFYRQHNYDLVVDNDYKTIGYLDIEEHDRQQQLDEPEAANGSAGNWRFTVILATLVGFFFGLILALFVGPAGASLMSSAPGVSKFGWWLLILLTLPSVCAWIGNRIACKFRNNTDES